MTIKAEQIGALTANNVGFGASNTGDMGNGINLGASPSIGTPSEIVWADHVHARDVRHQQKATGITQPASTPYVIAGAGHVTGGITLASTPISSAAGAGNTDIDVYLNGIWQEQGTAPGLGDFTVSGSIITYNAIIPISAGDVFWIVYRALT